MPRLRPIAANYHLDAVQRRRKMDAPAVALLGWTAGAILVGLYIVGHASFPG